MKSDMSEWRDTVMQVLFPDAQSREQAFEEQRQREMDEIFTRYQEIKDAIGNEEKMASFSTLDKLGVECTERLLDHIVTEIERYSSKIKRGMQRGPFPVYIAMVLDLPPEVSALITSRFIISNLYSETTFASLAWKLGLNLRLEYKFRLWDERQRARKQPGRRHVLSIYHGKPIRRKDLLEFCKKVQLPANWKNRELVKKLGGFFIGSFLHVMKDMFVVNHHYNGSHDNTRVSIGLTEEYKHTFLNKEFSASWFVTPLDQPMVYPPLDWVEKGSASTIGEEYTKKLLDDDEDHQYIDAYYPLADNPEDDDDGEEETKE